MQGDNFLLQSKNYQNLYYFFTKTQLYYNK